jgi:hypothetical protein
MKEEDLKLAKTLEQGGTMVDQILLDWKRDLAASTAARSLDDATSVISNVMLSLPQINAIVICSKSPAFVVMPLHGRMAPGSLE